MTDSNAAAAEISQIFAALDVPIVCRDDPKKGKHLICTKPLPANTALFEEVPIVSWSFASRKDRCCDHCMASLAPGAGVPCQDGEPGCPAVYCNEGCAASASKSHHTLLCGAPLAKIRAFDQKVYQERCGPGTKASSPDGALPKESSAQDADGSDDEPAEELPVTLEAVARAVASISNRYLVIAAANESATPAQLFPHAAALFNRLVATPDNADWSEIDSKLWFKTLRANVCPRLEQELLKFFSSSSSAAAAAAAEKSSARKEKAKQVMDAICGDATLMTLLGQLSLNSQALNLPVVPQSAEDAAALLAESDSDEVISDDEDASSKKKKKNAAAAEKKTVSDDSAAAAKKKAFEKKFARPSVGAGVFALHSAMNHSCDPNCIVVFDKDNDITVRLRRAVTQGEELTITYIPELFLKLCDFRARRERLKNYFFTCVCPVCVREEGGAAAAVAAAEVEKKPKEVEKKLQEDNDDA